MNILLASSSGLARFARRFEGLARKWPPFRPPDAARTLHFYLRSASQFCSKLQRTNKSAWKTVDYRRQAVAMAV